MADDYEDMLDIENMDDEEIEELVLQELGEYPDLDPDALEITVEDGFVILNGRIGTEQELQQIEHILTDVLGIANYSNELTVDELVRAEYAAGADDEVVEDETVESSTGESGGAADPQADHLLEDIEGQLYGTHDTQRAISRGESYEPPDRPIQEGSWSEETH